MSCTIEKISHTLTAYESIRYTWDDGATVEVAPSNLWAPQDPIEYGGDAWIGCAVWRDDRNAAKSGCEWPCPV